MASKNPSLTPFAALGAALFALSPCASFAQTPAPAAAPAMDSATANKLYDEAAKAFSSNDNKTAAEKLEALLLGVGKLNTPLIEQLRFSLGLAYLNDGKFTEAEKAFTDCLKQFPRGKGEYASRCYLGIGKARVAVGTDASKKSAIEPLQLAASDPKYRSEAGQTLGQVFTDLHMEKEALAVFRSLMGSDIRSPGQTVAAVEVISLLAQSGKLDDLVAYLDRLIRQAGIRDVIAWYSNQVIVAGDELAGSGNYEAALTIYRTILPRQQILDIQRSALEDLRKQVKTLDDKAKADEKIEDLSKRSNALELLNALKPAVEMTEKALKWVEDKVDLDAYMLMSRGRALFYLNRYEEAILCFKTIRTKYPKATDLQSAAYAEIVIMQKLKRTAELGALAAKFITQFPDSKNAEEVLSIVGESQTEALDYKGAANTYGDLVNKFPNSQNLEAYMFMQASALMSDGQFADAEAAFGKGVAKFPKGTYTESAYYRIAFCYFLTNDYKNTIAACQKYLNDYPGGLYYGDILYRLSFINFQDKTKNRADEILDSLGTYVESHKEDAAASSMYALIGDVWAQKKKDSDQFANGDAQGTALGYYIKAIWVKVKDQQPNWEVVKYCLDAANGIMDTKKDFDGITKLNGEFIKTYPDNPLAMTCVAQVAKVLIRQKKGEEAADYLGAALAPRIDNPGSEEAELLIQTLLNAVIPRVRKPTPEEIDDIEKKVVEALTKIIGTKANPTTNARLYYARALVRDKFHDTAKSDLYIEGIATSTAPEALSPQLLAVCAEVLMKKGDLDKAQAMYERLRDKYQESAFSDAGPVGVGRVALAKKQYPEALKLLNTALDNPGSSMIYEAMLGKVVALNELGQSGEAEALALKIIGDKQAGHKNIALAYLELADVLRKRAETAVGEAKRTSLIDANGRYQRVMTAYKAIPDLCAKAYWGSYEVLTALGDNSAALDVLRMLAKDPKMEKSPEAAKAKTIVK